MKHVLMQVLLQSSEAGQCGTTASCDASVPLSDISLSFSNPTVAAGEETGIEMSMLVTVPIAENQTIDVSLSGFSAPDYISDIQLDTAVFQTDSLFLTNDVPSMPPPSLIGCIRDNTADR
jgi:hypothetical protein